MNIDQLILAFGAILILARVVGWAFQQIGQPRVIGEMTAGILVGPSVFGRLFPGAFHYVLPSSSLPAITVLSQIGLLLFMFVVGLEVDPIRGFWVYKDDARGKPAELGSMSFIGPGTTSRILCSL